MLPRAKRAKAILVLQKGQLGNNRKLNLITPNMVIFINDIIENILLNIGQAQSVEFADRQCQIHAQIFTISNLAIIIEFSS